MVHARKVVHETIDGETIVIHLETGSYYSLTGSGAEIWGLVASGSSAASICMELARRHQRTEEDIKAEVESFLADLEHEQLVEPGDADPENASVAATDGNGTWAPPRLERFDDMRDFLLVDPIHEVDDRGWPNRKAAE